MEEYRHFNKEIEVSNLGNVKKNGVIVPLHKDEHYYYVLDGATPIRVHTMVGKCFPEICGEGILFGHYHHINHNQLDNRAENIRCISNSEHKKLHQVEDGVSVAVKAYDKKSNFVGRWDSKLQAAEATGADYRHISEIIEGKTRRFTAGKLYWFKEDTPEEEVINFINRASKNNHVWCSEKKIKKKPRVKLTEEQKKERRHEYYLKNREKLMEYSKNYYKNSKKIA